MLTQTGDIQIGMFSAPIGIEGETDCPGELGPEGKRPSGLVSPSSPVTGSDLEGDEGLPF